MAAIALSGRRARRANGEGSISFDAGRNRWVARIVTGWDDSGRPIRRKVTARTRADVKALLDRGREATSEGRPIPDDRLTVGAFLKTWCDSLPGTVSEGTEDAYRRRVRLYLTPRIGKIPLTKLTPADVSDLLADLEREGLSAATRQGARATLRRALRRAEQQGLVNRNAAALADGPRGAQREGRYLTRDEAIALIDALAVTPRRTAPTRGRPASSHRRLAPAVLTELALGLRVGETLGLRWQDIDLVGDPPTIQIVRQVQRRPKGRGLGLVDLKTRRSRRVIVLPEFLIDVLRAHRVRQNEDRLTLGPDWSGTQDLIFTTEFGEIVEPRTYARFVSRTCEEAGLGHRNTHALRHGAATILLAHGVPIEVVSDILGHSSIRLTKDVYGHLAISRQTEAAIAMHRAIGGLGTAPEQ